MGTSIKSNFGQQLSDFWKEDITESINKDLLKNNLNIYLI